MNNAMIIGITTVVVLSAVAIANRTGFGRKILAS